MKLKFTLLAIATSAALLAATAAAVESPMAGFPSLTGKLKPTGAEAKPTPVRSPVATQAAIPATAAVAQPAPKVIRAVEAKPGPAIAAKSAPAATKPVPTQPAGAIASKPAPVAATAARKAAAAVAAPVTVAAAAASGRTAVRFASTPTPTPTIAAVRAPVMATMGSSAQVRQYVLSSDEANYLAAEQDLKRQIRLLELRAQAAELQRKIDGEDKQAAIPDSVNVVAAPAVDPKGSVLDLPPPQPFRLVSVWGESSNLQADLLVNGVRVPVAVGHQLPDGWLVTAITANAVQIKRGRKAMALKIGG